MPVPASDNYLTDNEDLLWHLEHTIDWDSVVRLTEADFTLPDGPESVEEAKELYVSLLEEVGRFVASEIAPRAEGLDASGCKLKDGEVVLAEGTQEIFDQLGEMGLFGFCVPRELGGLNVPFALYFPLAEIMSRGDCGTMTHFSFYLGTAMALLAYSAKEGSLEVEGGQITGGRFNEAIEQLASGECWGAMVLTEPDAGSDLSAIRTQATQAEDGTWRLSGEKIFITSGQGQWQLVLARSADPKDAEAGLRGLSLYLVPRWIERDGERIENVKVTKVEKKLGHNSSPTVSLLYEDSEGELIGEEGQGFELMLVLMNNARLAVGFEGIGVCEAAYRMAMDYAGKRSSMGKLLKEHELLADVLQGMDTEIRGMRALAFEAVNASEISHKLEEKLRRMPPSDPAERERLERVLKRNKRQARMLTPLLKYMTSEKAVEFARTNMQIHGGMGYISETGADRLLRDALVLPVYEGTSQIQSLMALKDHLGFAMKDPAGFVRRAARARIQAQMTRGVERAVHQAEVKLYQAMESIVGRILGSKVKSEWSGELGQGSLGERLSYLRTRFLRSWDAREDFAHGLVHAERLTRILCDVEISRVLLRQGQEHPERMVYAKRYARRMLPRVTALLMEIQMGNDLDDLREEESEGEAA